MSLEAGDESIGTMLTDRDALYGDFAAVAMIAQTIKAAVATGPSLSRLSPCQREAIAMIATKIARIVTGDPDYTDSWVDIAGYAQLVLQQIERREEHQVREMLAALGADDASGCPASGDRDDEDDPD